MPNRSGFSIRDLAAVLGIIAVLLRGLIAPGLMPDLKAAANGDLKLVICSSGALKTLAQAQDDDTPQHHDSSDLCLFTVLGHPAVLADQFLPDGEVLHPVIEQTPHRNVVIASIARSRHARAPPRLS